MARLKTWHVESAVVFLVLVSTTLITGHSMPELLAAAAVWVNFGHAQIAERLREKEELRALPGVECYPLLDLYFIGKEVLWIAAFVSMGAWSALAGCVIFALYPVWRRLWRRWHPLQVAPFLPDGWDRQNGSE